MGADSHGPSSVIGGALTGAAVAFGVMLLLGALAGLVGMWTNVDVSTQVPRDEALTIGIGAAIAVIVAQFLAYMWGGYAGGRMAPGRSTLTGALVAVTGLAVALVLGILAAGSPDTAGAETEAARSVLSPLPFTMSELAGYGLAIAAGVLVAMLLGGLLGGLLAQRHYERYADDYRISETYTRVDERDERHVDTDEADDRKLRQTGRSRGSDSVVTKTDEQAKVEETRRGRR